MTAHSDLVTISRALSEGRAFLKDASTSPALDAEVMLTAILKKPREFLLSHDQDTVERKQLRTYRTQLTERRRGIPLPYLTKEKEFYNRSFIVTTASLVPRPETEPIIDAVRDYLDRQSQPVRNALPEPLRQPAELPALLAGGSLRTGSYSVASGREQLVVVDVGTGSGVLAVTLAAEFPRVRVVAVDRAGSALTVARRNARRHKVLRRIMFLESDLLQKIPEEMTPTVLVANLPYVPSDVLKHAGDDLDTRGLLFEPKGALDGGPDGLYVIRRFLAQLSRLPSIRDSLRFLVLEHLPEQERNIRELVHDVLPTFAPTRVTSFVTQWEQKVF